MNPLFVRRLDILREIYGSPIYVSCAYRCPSHNAELGGVPNSQHVQGCAADLYVDGDFWTFANTILGAELFDGVGIYESDQFVHVDLRDNGNSPNYYRW